MWLADVRDVKKQPTQQE